MLGEISLLTSLHRPHDVTRRRPRFDLSELCGICDRPSGTLTCIGQITSFFSAILLLYQHSTFIQLNFITVGIRTIDVGVGGAKGHVP